MSMNLSELQTSLNPGHVAVSQNAKFLDISNLHRSSFVAIFPFVIDPERLKHVFLVTREQAAREEKDSNGTVASEPVSCVFEVTGVETTITLKDASVEGARAEGTTSAYCK